MHLLGRYFIKGMKQSEPRVEQARSVILLNTSEAHCAIPSRITFIVIHFNIRMRRKNSKVMFARLPAKKSCCNKMRNHALKYDRLLFTFILEPFMEWVTRTGMDMK